MSLFNKVALEVCEGQQLDVDFETQTRVSLEEYFKMISYKTAVLVGCALKMGAIIASAGEEDQHEIYEFGLHLGIAFQLLDDYLDTFGSEDFGKRIGGDIVENKKTYLYIKTLELANEEDTEILISLYSADIDAEIKITEVKKLFKKYGVDHLLLAQIEQYTLSAFKNVERLSLDVPKKQVLIDFGRSLMNRKK
jgi:geranylgeranyl diphosphate synthase type II